MRFTIDFIGRNGDRGFGSGDWGKNFFQIFLQERRFLRASEFSERGCFAYANLAKCRVSTTPSLGILVLSARATTQRHFAKVRI